MSRRFRAWLGVLLLICSIVTVPSSAGAIYYNGMQCTGPGQNPNFLGRCLNKGFYTNKVNSDYKNSTRSNGAPYVYDPNLYPLENKFNYADTWSGMTYHAYPSISKAAVYNFGGKIVDYKGGPAVRNAQYAQLFTNLIESYLYNDYSAGGPNQCQNGPKYFPANRTDPPAGYNPNAAANKRSLNYYLDQFIGPDGRSVGTNCFTLRRNAVGASVIINVMMGKKGPDFSSPAQGIATAKSQLLKWRQLVYDYDSAGLVNWAFKDVAELGHLNSTGINGGEDDAWFRHEQAAYNATTIIFKNVRGGLPFTINRSCSNIIGPVEGLKPPLEYDVYPRVEVSTPYVEQGVPLTFTFRGYNDRSDTSSPLPYKVTELPGGPTGSHQFNPGLTTITSRSAATTTSPIGSRICATLTIGPPTANDNAIARSARQCATVVAKPYFNVTGGDVSAGAGMAAGGVDCGVPQNSQAGVVSWNRGAAANYAGAGSQYGAMVMNRLQDFASAQPTALTRPSGLAFANTNGGGVTRVSTGAGLFGGKVGASTCVPDYFAGSNATPGNRTISGQTIANGSRTKVYVDGDAYITGNIGFSGNYANAGQIPSYTLIVRGNIYIARTVTQLDGLYISQPRSATSGDGNIYTCATGPGAAAPLASTMYNLCTTPLTVNGAFVARQVWLQRSAGTVAKNIPAETFNYTPEVWIAPPSGTAVTSRTETYDAITSLPPVL